MWRGSADGGKEATKVGGGGVEWRSVVGAEERGGGKGERGRGVGGGDAAKGRGGGYMYMWLYNACKK